MTTFTVDITDKAQLAGIEAARNHFNGTLTPQVDDEGAQLPIETHPDYIPDMQSYVQHVMDSASKSYANNFNLTQDKIDKLQNDLDTAKAAVAAVDVVR